MYCDVAREPQGPKPRKKIKVTKKWLKSDLSGRPQSENKVTQKWLKGCKKSLFGHFLVTFESLFVPPSHFWVTFLSLWGRPEKSPLSHFLVTLIFSGFQALRLTRHIVNHVTVIAKNAWEFPRGIISCNSILQ